ncbi:MAG: DUF2177 family protein [Acetobacteraceae bacterium]|nr:DUF2177 family protein [Acetobacteraceae bacterium]
MRTNLIAYVVTAIIFFGMDFAWLSFASGAVYKPRIGALLLDSPNMPIAAAFYLLYVIGILAFAVFPAIDQASLWRAVWGGALLGLVAYGTYDVTNLATLIGWSGVVSVIDMAWGVFVTGLAASLAYLVVRAL